jgi:hypothetical protein
MMIVHLHVVSVLHSSCETNINNSEVHQQMFHNPYNDLCFNLMLDQGVTFISTHPLRPHQ